MPGYWHVVGPSPALGGLQIPAGLVVGLASATLEFWVRFPNDMPGYRHVVGPRSPCMAKHAAQRRHQGVNRRTAGDDGRHTTHRTHITPHILISYSPYGTAYFLCTLHQFNGIFTLACSPTDANRSNSQRNQPEPSALLPARSSELIACCSDCAPTYAPLASSLLLRARMRM